MTAVLSKKKARPDRNTVSLAQQRFSMPADLRIEHLRLLAYIDRTVSEFPSGFVPTQAIINFAYYGHFVNRQLVKFHPFEPMDQLAYLYGLVEHVPKVHGNETWRLTEAMEENRMVIYERLHALEDNLGVPRTLTPEEMPDPEDLVTVEKTEHEEFLAWKKAMAGKKPAAAPKAAPATPPKAPATRPSAPKQHEAVTAKKAPPAAQKKQPAKQAPKPAPAAKKAPPRRVTVAAGTNADPAEPGFVG